MQNGNSKSHRRIHVDDKNLSRMHPTWEIKVALTKWSYYVTGTPLDDGNIKKSPNDGEQGRASQCKRTDEVIQCFMIFHFLSFVDSKFPLLVGSPWFPIVWDNEYIIKRAYQEFEYLQGLPRFISEWTAFHHQVSSSWFFITRWPIMLPSLGGALRLHFLCYHCCPIIGQILPPLSSSSSSSSYYCCCYCRFLMYH